MISLNLCDHQLFFKKCVFIQKEWEGGEGQREGEREKPKQALCFKCRARCRVPSHDCEIMIWAEIKSRTFNQLSQPSTLIINFYILLLHRIFFVNQVVTTNQKPVIDAQKKNNNEKGINYKTKENCQTIWEESNRVKNQRTTNVIKKNNTQNSSKYISINNYYKCSGAWVA